MDKLPQDDGEAVCIYLMVIVFFLAMPQRDRTVKLFNHNLRLNKFSEAKEECRTQKMISSVYSTSGAIQRYVPVSAVIISVSDSSLAKPKSASLTVL